jgi:hypothetical protein
MKTQIKNSKLSLASLRIAGLLYLYAFVTDENLPDVADAVAALKCSRFPVFILVNASSDWKTLSAVPSDSEYSSWHLGALFVCHAIVRRIPLAQALLHNIGEIVARCMADPEPMVVHVAGMVVDLILRKLKEENRVLELKDTELERAISLIGTYTSKDLFCPIDIPETVVSLYKSL